MAYANPGYTYRVPTFTDLYYEDPGNLSNPDLEPEYSLAYEAGIKSVLINSVRFQSSLFVRKGSNLIDRIKENEEDKWMPVNVRETIFRGFESNISVFPRSISGLDRFIISRISIGYLFNNSEIVGTEPGYSRFSLDNLRNQLVFSADLSYGRRLTHTIKASYTDRLNSKSYTVVDTRLSLNYRNLTIFCEFANLTNTEYSEIWDVKMPGFNIMVGGSVNFDIRKPSR